MIESMWLLGAIAAEVAATLMLRGSDGLRNRVFLAPVALGYVVSALSLSVAIKSGMQVGVAYGIWAACGIVSVAVLARFLFRDPLTPMMMVGMFLIAGGVILVEVGG